MYDIEKPRLLSVTAKKTHHSALSMSQSLRFTSLDQDDDRLFSFNGLGKKI